MVSVAQPTLSRAASAMVPDDFDIDTSAAGRAVVSGVLRLASPASYAKVFAPIGAGIEQADAVYTLDIAGVRFMNSSGITALSRLVLLARKCGRSLVLVGTTSVPWQKKTLSSLGRLYSGVDVRLDA